MRLSHPVAVVMLLSPLILLLTRSNHVTQPAISGGGARFYDATGVVQEVKDSKTIVIKHEAITNYMAAMTMPFKVKQPKELEGIARGYQVTFRLNVTEEESWIDRVRKIGVVAMPAPEPASKTITNRPPNPLLSYNFTNELGQPMSLGSFKGQALGITFFFTRCPLPDFCPRLSKNFEQAGERLLAMPDAPTNWHFISVSFDTENDTPAALKAYGERYHYNPAHWSFLTGPADKISELAQASGASYQKDGLFYGHNFRTEIVDASGRLQMVFPITGDLSDAIVKEILKAAAATNSSRLPITFSQTNALPVQINQ
jgi:protein SCO1/2